MKQFYNSNKQIETINFELEIGEKSGKPKPFDNEKFKMRMRKYLIKDLPRNTKAPNTKY